MMKTIQLRGALFLMLFTFCSVFAIAQNRTISGVVKDTKGIPVIGATILVEAPGESPIGTVTNIDGEYSISVPQSRKTMTISYVGYTTVKEAIKERNKINIVLEESSVVMNELVAIGYAKVQKKDLTGASVQVSGADLAMTPVASAAQALAGKAAGVSVISQSGAPGADINITVRGGTSITQGVKPLYIVDGFQMDDALNIIDVNDIATIDVMKDASSTAIYGARGSNGVIIITTKSAKKGRTEVSYNTFFSFETLGRKLNLLSVEDYVKYQYEYQLLAGKTNDWANMFGGNVNDPNFYTGAYSYIHNQYANSAGIDWQDEVFGGTALTQSHNVNVNHGSEKTSFSLSYNYMGQNGLLEKSGFQRNSVRAKVNHELFKGIRLDFNSGFNDRKLDGGGSLGGTLKQTILQPLTGGVRFTNDQMLNNDITEEMQKVDTQYDIYNPILENRYKTQLKKTRQFDVGAGLEIDILKDLMFRTAGNYLWIQEKSESFTEGKAKPAVNKGGAYGNVKNKEKYSYQITNTLNYSKLFDQKHQFGALLGQEVYFTESRETENDYGKFPDVNFGLNNITMGTPLEWKSSISKDALVSVFTRLSYSFDHRYMLNVTLRGDGSSKFAVGKQWGFFPSASAAWRVSEEGFWKSSPVNDVMNGLKLRLGYGTSGNNNIDDFMYATDYAGSDYPIGGANHPTLAPGDVVGNPNLRWETTISANVGLDLSFFNSRLNLGVDLYNNESKDLLIKNNIPTSTGYTFQYQNVGSIRNQGLEITLNSQNIRNKNFEWTSDFNISFNKSKVLEIYGQDSKTDYMPMNVESRVDYRVIVGEALGKMYGYKTDGVYTTNDFTQNPDGTYQLKDGVPRLKGINVATIKPGDVKYQCINGDTDANGNPTWSTADRTIIGNGAPIFQGGFTNTFRFFGFDASLFLNFSFGNQIFNMSTQRFIGPYLPNQNTISEMVNRFTLVDPHTGRESTDLARLAELNPNQHSSGQLWSLNSVNKIAISDALDRYVEDGSFLRIGTLTLGYTLPKELTMKAKISRLRIYATANNLYTFTKYSGYDPEVASSDKIITPGVDNSSYPRAKSFVVGLNLTF